MSRPEDGLWRRAPSAPDGPVVAVTVDGREVRAFVGESVATLLLRLGHDHFGTHPASGAPLAPWCLMGTCFGCLCTIDGRPGSQACLEPVRDGLAVATATATATNDTTEEDMAGRDGTGENETGKSARGEHVTELTTAENAR